MENLRKRNRRKQRRIGSGNERGGCDLENFSEIARQSDGQRTSQVGVKERRR